MIVKINKARRNDQSFHVEDSFARSRPGIPAEYAYLVDAVPDVARPTWKGDVPGKWKRLAVGLLILVFVVAAVFLLPALFPGTQARR